MLNTDQMLRILQESALFYRHSINIAELKGRELSNRDYGRNEVQEFLRDLIETGNTIRILLLEYTLDLSAFQSFIRDLQFPVLVLRQSPENIEPILLQPQKGKIRSLTFGLTDTTESPFQKELHGLADANNKVTFYSIHEYDHLVSEATQAGVGKKDVSPTARLFRLLKTEKKDILYIIFYALVVGLISLSIPLGIQTTTELISGGVFFSSIYLLIGLIIFGVLFMGLLQMMQLTMVEYLQRRIFTKAAFEFAYRLPRIKNEALTQYYVPELVNRFFDVLTIQKGLPKLLIELFAAFMQILFGLLLISLYHPFFVFFAIVLLGILFLIFFFTGPEAIRSSIEESKYKYKVAYWLQELGRAINSFKVTGNSNLPLRQTDANVNNYLKYRREHFKILLQQYGYILLFKTGITAALLILGAILVINREITLGQFVASEVIIIIILNSVEKIITSMDVIYDLLTAVDKIAYVTDLPLERNGGLDFPQSAVGFPLKVEIKKLSYQYPHSKHHALKEIDLVIEPGSRVCIAGKGGSGKTALTQLITGLYGDFEGIITINDYSQRDMDLVNWRDHIAKNISMEDIFDASVLENVAVGKPNTSSTDVITALKKVGLSDWANALPDGLNTRLISGGKGLPRSVIFKMILARCIAKKPGLIVLNDFFSGFSKKDKTDLLEMLCDQKNPWSLIAVSNDPAIMGRCDKVVVLESGRKVAEGPFDRLMQQQVFNEFMD